MNISENLSFTGTECPSCYRGKNRGESNTKALKFSISFFF